ncbi:hypothetical protein AB4076_20425 [Dyella sp. 2RAF44]|uniref:hypothetical protein n=1 Tax=Dyella sp. 2RAF44 TaxID=3233000 RepID=UPI003F92A44F
MSTLGVLFPVRVPWMISPSVPYLRMELSEQEQPAAATFIGFFELEIGSNTVAPFVVRDPGEFVRSNSMSGAAHRLVKVLFEEVSQARILPAVSDLEVISEQRYDWSNVPSGIDSGETAEQSVSRVGSLWKATGFCPDPRMYEVGDSSWIKELGLDASQWRHYILLGHDEYVEVVARQFDWQPGQIA